MRNLQRRSFALLAFFFIALISTTVNTKAAEKISKTMTLPVFDEVTRSANGTTKVTWGKVKSINGYQIQYSADWTFAKGTKTKMIRSAQSTQTTFTKSQISTTKDTYFRIRSYKESKGVKTYSKWGQKVRLVVWNSKLPYAQYSKIHTGTCTVYYAPHTIRKKIAIAVNAGHGTAGGASKKTLSHPDESPKLTDGTTEAGKKYSTAISGGTDLSTMSEANANLLVAKKLKKLLLNNGYDVVMIRQNENVQLDNIARTVLANKLAKCHIAIHFDSTTTDKGAFYVGVPNIRSYRNMVPVKNLYKRHAALGESMIWGLQYSKVKILRTKHIDLDLTQTSYSTIPSVDIELGDKKTSTADKNLSKMADGLLVGVQRFISR